MGSTLSELRTALNDELGLASDSDNRFGTTTSRNNFLISAFRKLWPMMGQLVTQEIAVADNTTDYYLDAIRDVERIEIVGAEGLVSGSLRTWRVLRNEEADPPTLTLLVQPLQTEQTMRVIGYAPYTVPLVDADTSELPVDQEIVVIAGALANAYRRRLNQFVDYEQQATANRTTTITPDQMMNLWGAAKAEFEQLRSMYRRKSSGPRRARLTIEG